MSGGTSITLKKKKKKPYTKRYKVDVRNLSLISSKKIEKKKKTKSNNLQLYNSNFKPIIYQKDIRKTNPIDLFVNLKVVLLLLQQIHYISLQKYEQKIVYLSKSFK